MNVIPSNNNNKKKTENKAEQKAKKNPELVCKYDSS